MTENAVAAGHADLAAGGWSPRRLWDRRLAHYPDSGARSRYLAIAVLATIVLYYELYIQGAVSTKIIADFHMSLRYFVLVSIVGNALGAFASLAAGLADRWGRANLVTYGLLLTGVLVTVGLPLAGSKLVYLVLFAVVSMVEGVILVATPALVRDFSPQLGRASAMGFWTLGPVVGSLVVTEVSSHTLAAHADWQFQFRVAGVVGLVVFAIALLGLRELSPRLRDQLMVSLRDRALVEARAAGIDPDAVLGHPWRQMLRFDVIGPAFAISVFLLFYYVAVGFFVVYYATDFGYSEARANALANWYWIADAVALVVTGVVSDRLKVRKPFMVVGAAISAVGVALFAVKATDVSTSYYTFVAITVVIAVGGGIAYCAWMAAFTETVERHNPAATATGLAVWGWVIRMVVTVALVALTFLVGAANTLVDQGPTVQAVLAAYPQQVATLQRVDPTTLARLQANPADSAAQVKALTELTAAHGLTAAQVAQVLAIAAAYPQQVTTLARVDTATLTTLQTDPTDTAAQVRALTELTAGQGLTAAQVGRVLAVSARYPRQVAVLGAVDTATLLTLSTDPTDATAIRTAVGEIAATLHEAAAAATADLASLARVPRADLVLLATDGAPVKAAAARLTALSKVPTADLLTLATAGPPVTRAAARLRALSAVPPRDLAYLASYGARVAAASKQSPHQWQRWWWICFAGQLLFLPFIFVLAGRWDPRVAAVDAAEHERAVSRELAALTAPRTG